MKLVFFALILSVFAACSDKTEPNTDDVSLSDTGADISTSDQAADTTLKDVRNDFGTDVETDTPDGMDTRPPGPTTNFCKCDVENPADAAGSFEMCAEKLPNGIGTQYVTGRDGNSLEHLPAGLPKGVLTEAVFSNSAIYPDTTWKYAVYVPATYDGSEDAALMVFMDGYSALRRQTTNVFDNLTDAGKTPTTILVFVDPGMSGDVSKRSEEYDQPDDIFPRFLINELLVEALDGLRVTAEPSKRGIVGTSSGAVAAFKTAWFFPESFGLVLTTIGSWVRLRANAAGEFADIFPEWIRAEPPKKIRVTLLSGRGDNDNQFGDWRDAHMKMTAALDCAGYDYISEFGDSSHGYTPAIRSRFVPDLVWLFQ